MRTQHFVLLCSFLFTACSAQPAVPARLPTPAEAVEQDATPGDLKDQVAGQIIVGGADAITLDPCARYGWYNDGECDWVCFHADPDCAPPSLGPEPSGTPARYPILLVHGFNASGGLFGFSDEVMQALEGDGNTVFITQVSPYTTVAARAVQLKEQVDQILRVTRAEKVNIIAHSMGGLDSRYLISTFRYGDRVASLTTISTPHHGTPVADLAIAAFGDGSRNHPILDALFLIFGESFTADEERGDTVDIIGAAESLSIAGSEPFNERNVDDGRVYYQSWAGISTVLGRANPHEADACENQILRHEGTADKVGAALLLTAPIVAFGRDRVPGDGLVSVDSAKWGNFRGCFPADHMDEIGVNRIPGPDGNTGLDLGRFYRNIASDLAERGF